MNDVILLFSGQEEHGLPAAHSAEQGCGRRRGVRGLRRGAEPEAVETR